MSDTTETGREGAESAPGKKSATRKSTAKRSTAKKTAAKKTTAKRATAKRTSAKTAAAKTEPKRSRNDGSGGGSAVTGARVAYVGAEQLVEMTRKPFEGVVGLERTDDGWTVEVEVLEMRRIPETTDIIGVYEVSVDTSGELVSYRRVHRYLRGGAGDER